MLILETNSYYFNNFGEKLILFQNKNESVTQDYLRIASVFLRLNEQQKKVRKHQVFFQ